MDLYKVALTHSSFSMDKPGLENNERLEFYGDAVLKLVFSKYLYDRYPEAPEGKLTQYRANLVSDSVLAEIGFSLGFHKSIKVGSSLRKKKYPKSIIANAVEAYIGATYIEEGYEAAESFILDNWNPILDKAIKEAIESNFKADLQEKIQSIHHRHPVYRTLNTEGPPHDRKFEIGVYLEDQLLGTGEGKSKKMASQMAAKDALEKLSRTLAACKN